MKGPSALRAISRPARTGLVFSAMVVAGLAALAAGWFGVSGTVDVADQVPYAISGGIGGMALVVAGCGLLAAHIRRCGAAREDAALDQVLATASALVEAGVVVGVPVPATAARKSAPRRAAATRLRSMDPQRGKAR